MGFSWGEVEFELRTVYLCVYINVILLAFEGTEVFVFVSYVTSKIVSYAAIVAYLDDFHWVLLCKVLSPCVGEDCWN